jgi:integrase
MVFECPNHRKTARNSLKRHRFARWQSACTVTRHRESITPWSKGPASSISARSRPRIGSWRSGTCRGRLSLTASASRITFADLAARWLESLRPALRPSSYPRRQTSIAQITPYLGLRDFTHHTLRHYFVSNAVELGIDYKVIAQWVGHKDGGLLVAKTYGHLRDTHSAEMARRTVFSAPPGVENIDVSDSALFGNSPMSFHRSGPTCRGEDAG